MEITREQVREQILHSGLDEFDAEDLDLLVESLLEWEVSPLMIYTWLCWPDPELGGTPLVLIRHGRIRDVALRARSMVSA